MWQYIKVIQILPCINKCVESPSNIWNWWWAWWRMLVTYWVTGTKFHIISLYTHCSMFTAIWCPFFPGIYKYWRQPSSCSEYRVGDADSYWCWTGIPCNSDIYVYWWIHYPLPDWCCWFFFKASFYSPEITEVSKTYISYELNFVQNLYWLWMKLGNLIWTFVLKHILIKWKDQSFIPMEFKSFY